MAYPVITKKQLLITACESIYGTDRAPQEANSYQPIKLVDPFTLDLGQEFVEQAGGLNTRGYIRPIGTVRPAGVTFRTFVQGLDSGSYTNTAGAARKPAIGDLLRACGLLETFVSSNASGRPEYQYAPSGEVDSDASLTIVAHQDGYDHRFVGARGNVNLIYLAATPLIAEFNFRGLLSTEADTVRGNAAGFATEPPPRWIGSGTVFVQSLHALIENLNFSTNNQLFEQRASIANSGSGIAKIVITDRQPGGSMDPEASHADSFDFINVWRSSSGSVLRLQVGLAQSQVVTLIASQAVFKASPWGDKSGLAIFNVDYQAYERSGNDEFRLIFS